jgi:hypothetical protein
MKYPFDRPLKDLRDSVRLRLVDIAGEGQESAVSRAECGGSLSDPLTEAMAEKYGVPVKKIQELHRETRENKEDADSPHSPVVRLVRRLNARLDRMDKTLCDIRKELAEPENNP